VPWERVAQCPQRQRAALRRLSPDGCTSVSGQDPVAIDRKAPPFDKYRGVDWLAPARSGRHAHERGRHQLYVGTGRDNPVRVLIKVTSKPGLVYERDLANEIATLEKINRALPDSRYFPFAYEHGHLDDGRLYLVMSLFDEFPLATIVGTDHVADRLVAHLMTAIEVARALAEVHRLGIFHVDLNPMNILYRTERGRPVIRIVDFESSYEPARHAKDALYNPPTTPGYTAPEVTRQAPDARSDLYSLGAVLYTLVAGDLWVRRGNLGPRVEADDRLDVELRQTLLKAVAPVPADRYPSVTEFRVALAAYLERIWPGRSW
jgi:serine/threonine protein kinase